MRWRSRHLESAQIWEVLWPCASKQYLDPMPPLQQKTNGDQKLGQHPPENGPLSRCWWHQDWLYQHTQPSSPLQLLSKPERERYLSYITAHLLFQKAFGEHLLKLEIGVNAENFPGGSDGKESACNARDLGSIPGLGRSPGVGNSYPLQYSCLENSMDRGDWRATVHGVTKSQTQLSDYHLTWIPWGLHSQFELESPANITPVNPGSFLAGWTCPYVREESAIPIQYLIFMEELFVSLFSQAL